MCAKGTHFAKVWNKCAEGANLVHLRSACMDLVMAFFVFFFARLYCLLPGDRPPTGHLLKVFHLCSNFQQTEHTSSCEIKHGNGTKQEQRNVRHVLDKLAPKYWDSFAEVKDSSHRRTLLRFNEPLCFWSLYLISSLCNMLYCVFLSFLFLCVVLCPSLFLLWREKYWGKTGFIPKANKKEGWKKGNGWVGIWHVIGVVECCWAWSKTERKSWWGNQQRQRLRNLRMIYPVLSDHRWKAVYWWIATALPSLNMTSANRRDIMTFNCHLTVLSCGGS